jgi:membrane protease YdiL (CAAX protease family)
MRSYNVRVALLLYALLAALAIALGFLRGEPNIFLHPRPVLSLPLWQGLVLGVLVGFVFGVAAVWFSQRAVAVWRWRPALRLHAGLRQTLGVSESPMSTFDIVALTASSAIAEELLFRGWLTPLTGVVVSSLLFGLMHYTPRNRGMWSWIPAAFVIGLALGWMFELVGNLTAPIIAHAVINHRNLRFIGSYDPNRAIPPEKSGG